MTYVNKIVMATSAQHTPSQREKKRSDTRERIFEAAVEEFAREGFANAQIPRIAAQAGVVRGTFYFHFASKEHVLIELAERDHERISGELATLRDNDTPLPDVLTRLLDCMTPDSDAEPEANLRRDVLALYMREAHAKNADELGDPEQSNPVLNELTHHISEAIARGQVRDDVEPERLAAAVLTSIFGLVVARKGTASDNRPELELLIELLLHGMGPLG